MNVGGHVVVEDSRKQIILYRSAQTIKSILGKDNDLPESELADLKKMRFGYLEQAVEETDVCGVWYEKD